MRTFWKFQKTFHEERYCGTTGRTARANSTESTASWQETLVTMHDTALPRFSFFLHQLFTDLQQHCITDTCTQQIWSIDVIGTLGLVLFVDLSITSGLKLKLCALPLACPSLNSWVSGLPILETWQKLGVFNASRYWDALNWWLQAYHPMHFLQELESSCPVEMHWWMTAGCHVCHVCPWRMTGFRDSALQKLATELRERQVGHGAGDNCGSNQNGMFQAVLKLSSGCLSFRNCRLSRICKLNQLQDAESLVSLPKFDIIIGYTKMSWKPFKDGFSVCQGVLMWQFWCERYPTRMYRSGPPSHIQTVPRWRFDGIFLRSFIPVQCFCRPFRSTPLEKSSAPPFCFVFLGVFFFFLWPWKASDSADSLVVICVPPVSTGKKLMPSWRHYATLQKPGWIEAICRPGRCGGWTSWSACPGPCSTFLQQKTN